MIKKKILFFIKIPPPITGATLMNERIYKSSFINEKYNINTIKVSYAKNIKDLGKVNFYKLKIFFKNIFVLLYNLVFFKPNLIYFQISTTGLSFYRDSIYVLIMKLFRIKIIFHLRSKGVKRNTKSFLIRKYYKIIFKNVYSICLSDIMIKDIDHICNIKSFVVHNGYPEIDFNFSKNINKNQKILFLSNLLIEKGIIDYLDALKILKKYNNKFSGLIVGQESDLDKNELINEINKRNLSDEVKYLGPLYGKDKYKVLMESDIFIFPTFYKVETFGGVVIEAMQSKLPVICTDISSLPLIIDNNKTGFIVNINSPNQIAEKILLLLENEKLKNTMGINGYKKYLKFYTFKEYEKNMDLVFKKVLK